MLLDDSFQAFENNEQMKLKARGESSEEAQAPVVDKVCVIKQFLDTKLQSGIEVKWQV